MRPDGCKCFRSDGDVFKCRRCAEADLYAEKKTALTNRRIFVDMDGVLADFDTHHLRVFGKVPDWSDNAWKGVPGFFAGIPPMPDMVKLWQYVERHDPIVLTGLPKTDPAIAWGEKRAWLDRYIGTDIPMIGCLSRDKFRYGREGDVLIDDREQYMKYWRGMGGVWITHTSAKNSIEQLRAYGL